MTSATDICNTALTLLGETPNISSIDPPDGSMFAQKCARFYPMARTMVAEARNWSFVRRRKALAPLTDNPSTYPFAYALPAECMRPRVLLPANASPRDEMEGGEDFLVEGRALYTCTENPTLLYSVDEPDITKWSPSAQYALAVRLAAFLSGAIVQDFAQTKGLLQMYALALSESAQVNANVGQTTYHHEPAWITQRGPISSFRERR